VPRVSVVIPTFNRAEVVGRAIGSVLAQTYRDYEVIVVDDGSSDSTPSLVAALAQGRPFIRYLPQPHCGRSAARNHGMAVAQGEYVAFLDSDDVFLPDKLRVQVEALDQNRAYGMVYSMYLAVDEAGRPLPGGGESPERLSGQIYPEMLFIQRALITTPSVMVRRMVLAEVGGFDETMHMCEDLDLWRRIARRHQVLQIETPLVQVTYRRSDPLALAEKLAARSHYYRKAFAEDPGLSPSVQTRLWTEMYWHYGSVALVNRDLRQGIVWLASAARHSPRGFAGFAGRASWRRAMQLLVRVLIKPWLAPRLYNRLRRWYQRIGARHPSVLE